MKTLFKKILNNINRGEPCKDCRQLKLEVHRRETSFDFIQFTDIFKRKRTVLCLNNCSGREAPSLKMGSVCLKLLQCA